MENKMLVTNRTARKNKFLRANAKACKKREKGRRFFDFRARIYKLVSLCDEEFIDLTGEDVKEKESPSPPLAEDILKRIEDAGVVGMSGGGFPSVTKLRTVMDSDSDEKFFIVNAIECDPILLHDEWLLKNRWNEIKQGIADVLQCVRFKKVIVASRHDVCGDISGIDADISFVRLDYLYPLGEEHVLIEKTLGRRFDKKDVPAANGILVMNVQTLISIGKAVGGYRPNSRYLTAADLTNGRARIVKAPYGMDAREVLTRALGENDKTPMYIGSGAMRSHRMKEGEKISAATGCLSYANEVVFGDPSACIGCGTCQKKCPVKIPAAGMMKAIKYGSPMPDFVADTCLGCRSCSYFCRAGIDTKSIILPDE